MKKSCLGAGESRPAAELEKENEELKNRIKELEAKVASLEEVTIIRLFMITHS